MAAAEQIVPPGLTIELAQQLEPGIQTTPKKEPGEQFLQGDSGPLPSTDQGVLPRSNLFAELSPPDRMPDPRPSRVLFAGLRDPRLRMVQAVPLDVTVEDSNVIVCWKEIDEFGVGESLTSAMDDFSNVVRELYYFLQDNSQIGPDIEAVKRVLGEYIVPR